MKDAAKFSKALAKAAENVGVTLPPAPDKPARAKALDPLVTLLVQQANTATRVTSVIASNELADFQQAASGFNPTDLGLPAQLRVARVFGELYYNRETGFLRGSVGGRLEFPDINAFFEVREATIDNNGNFTIDAATAFTPPPLAT